jgi:hypothetical protein
MRLEWAVAGLVMWLISLDTCLVCQTESEPLDVSYAQQESERGIRRDRSDDRRYPLAR